MNGYDTLHDLLRTELGHRSIEALHTLVVMGSGMSGSFAEDELDVLYQSNEQTVDGHHGTLALLRSASMPTLLSLGRRHLYEGCTPDEIVNTVNTAALLGTRYVVLTNAAGALNPMFRTGELMLITDVITMMLGSKVRGFGRTDRLQPSIFAEHLYPAIEGAARESGIPLHRGVYAAVQGPSYETRAEIGMLRRMGADAVGMSTALEAIAARQAGMHVIGISLLTNSLSEFNTPALSHTDVVDQGQRQSNTIRRVIENCISSITMQQNTNNTSSLITDN